MNLRRPSKLTIRGLWLTLLMLTAVLTIQWQTPAVAAQAKPYDQLTFPALPEVEIPEYTQFTMDNGMTVFLMEDRELPLVSGQAMFYTGDRLEPLAQVGLADLVGTVMRSGGTQTHSPDELNQELEQRAASIETGIGRSIATAQFRALTPDTDAVLSLFAEVLRQPAFNPEQLALAKTQLQGSIARRNDRPDGIAHREFRKLIYGSESPYGRTIEYETLEAIARPDLIEFYQQYFVPNNMMLGIVGDFKADEMRAKLEKIFGSWKRDPNFKRPPLPEVAVAQEGGIFIVDRPQVTQSNILMGHLGGRFDSPDYAALSVMNEVLNGFGGRLFNEVRSRQGLAYSVYGFWSPRFDYPGIFVAGGSTRSDATVPFIQAIRKELQEIRTTPVTPEELQAAQDAVLNSFVFNFAEPSQTLSRIMRYTYYGYPEDFIFQYQKGVENTTIADVQRVARTYLQPEDIVTLVVGNEAEIDPPLTALGQDVKVTAIDITIAGES
ncbi:pitrilysin family protein [Roseofilum casamattae]|uniref:Pitrilysin family protein n=1 Tax=Roseofilum casamattae BLCC-M143 TaxID=3022442 RepID=A0ABT7BZZ2_9CYAN|nr:pitrilysin family protein [Roseofilum casamattae]MDJ1184765.1 pitrilysin family protein [Roseofilum casamattae BLCC-M143]